MRPTTDRLLIVIPCLNEERHIETLLQQFLAECPEALIVVADGGSIDASRGIVNDVASAYANVILLDNPARIQSAGVNLAVKRFATGREWLLRVDAHCDYPRGYAHGLLAAAAERSASSVVVPMVSKGTNSFQIAAATAQNSPLGHGGSPHRRIGSGQFVDHGHHALMRLDLYQQVGGYDQSLSHNEDAELDQRLLAAGGRIWLEPGQAITYYPRSDPRALWRQYRGYGAGRFATMLRHRRFPKLRQLLPLAVPLAVILAILAVPVLALAILENANWAVWLSVAMTLPMMIWATLCLTYGMVLGILQRQPYSCASGIPAMIAHLAWGVGFLQQAARFQAGEEADCAPGEGIVIVEM